MFLSLLCCGLRPSCPSVLPIQPARATDQSSGRAKREWSGNIGRARAARPTWVPSRNPPIHDETLAAILGRLFRNGTTS